jgi:ribosomal protein S18 acetylase RimI-like enzyme
MSPATTKRRATEADEAFLFELFKAVRSPDFEHVPISQAQRDLLMQVQYAGQIQTYAAQYPESKHELILMDGHPVGRIWIHETPEEHRLVDIAVLPGFQSRGIGTGVLKEAIANAGKARVRLCCAVAVSNASSLRFHERLGFRMVSHDQVYYELALEP